jgi:hypothetical protein
MEKKQNKFFNVDTTHNVFKNKFFQNQQLKNKLRRHRSQLRGALVHP